MKQKLLLTCEHASNHVPAKYKNCFHDKNILETHRAYDIGAAEVCDILADRLHAPAIMAEISRLVIELNRSLHHPGLYSEFMRNVSVPARREIVSSYYLPYRSSVMTKIKSMLKSCDRIIHVSVHSFTPVMNGVTRNADVGLLYDPSRRHEKQFALAWKTQLREIDYAIRVRCNYPYKGISDGFTTFLRKEFKPDTYVGIELEMNQAILQDARKRRVMSDLMARSLDGCLK